MKKALKYVVIYLFLEVISISLLMVRLNFIYFLSIIFNSIITFYTIKCIEKIYYKKYNKINSLLYNLCPLIGISFIFFALSSLIKYDFIIFLRDYYICVFIIYYMINILYIIISKIKHS